MVDRSFERGLKFLWDAEGGTNYHVRDIDRGGLTNFGISVKQYPNEDIENMTIHRAAFLYKRDYWTKNSCHKMEESVAVTLFDCSVNCGQPSAAVWLQKSLQLIAPVSISVDGVIGPHTLAVLDFVDSEKLIQYLLAHRLKRYGRIIRNRPEQKAFIGGWIDRVANLVFYL